MRHNPIRLGPLALLLTVISLCMATLAILTLSTARADLSLAQRHAETVRVRCELDARGQQLLYDADEMLASQDTLPENDLSQLGLEAQEDGTWTASLEQDGTILSITLRPESDTMRVARWQITKQWDEDTSLDPVWDGKGRNGT